MTEILRGTGLVPDDPVRVVAENRAHPLIFLTGAPQPRPVRLSWRHLLDGILDQRWTNSCVGCAFATAVYLCGQAKQRPVLRPSAKAFYDGARLRGGPVEELIDWGCKPLDAIEAARKNGLVRESSWPLFTDDPELLKLAVTKAGKPVDWINAEPPFSLYFEGADAKLTGYYRADTGAIIELLEHALALGEIPVYGQHILDGYGQVTGATLYDTPTLTPPPGLPTHLQAICGYDEEAFEVVSSWGAGHGDRGIVRVRKSVIAGPWAFARMVITSVPAALAA